ncbi:MAG: septum formation initiator family protein [Bacilli bacterium]|jgi:cell division protein DivIC|nr:septum formation initiator family protein [Bacilli bacterium]
MKKRVSSKVKRRLCLLSGVLVAVISIFVGAIFQDWIQIVQNKTLIADLNYEYNELLSQEESLNSEVTKLHDMEYVARYAREKYMYSLPNEIIIKIPNSSK